MSKKRVAELVAIGQKCSKLWKTKGVAYADVVISGNRVTCRIQSKQFANWLKKKYYSETGLDGGKKVMLSAISTLATVTEINGLERKLFNRVGEENGYYYLDLGTSNCFVRYSASGWEIVKHSPIIFSRSAHYSPLPIPSSDTDIGCGLEDFYGLIGVTEKHQSKLTEFLARCLVPSSNELTIDFYGACGVSSSRAAEACKQIIDPCTINQLYRFPSRAKLTEHVEMSRVVLYEYFSCQDISPDNIDDVACISQGEDFAVGISRPQITACSESVKRWIPEHCISVDSVKGGMFECEFDYWTEFSIVHPEVLGALLDRVCDRLAVTAG
jgi:hypothetical protein